MRIPSIDCNVCIGIDEKRAKHPTELKEKTRATKENDEAETQRFVLEKLSQRPEENHNDPQQQPQRQTFRILQQTQTGKQEPKKSDTQRAQDRKDLSLAPHLQQLPSEILNLSQSICQSSDFTLVLGCISRQILYYVREEESNAHCCCCVTRSRIGYG